MGEWTTVYEDEVEGRSITVKVYQSEDTADDDGDEGPTVRVTACSVDDGPGVPEEHGDTLLVEREAAGRLITLESYGLDDLEGELIEIGFSPEAAATIASKVPG